MALSAVAGCADTSTTATGQVDSASFGRICFTPENSDRTDLIGCWPISAADAAGVEQGDCIKARIPTDADARVTHVQVLDRECHVGVEPQASTSVAIQSLMWLLGIGGVAVFFAVVLPRLRRRRALAREEARRTPPAPPAAPVEIGESEELTVFIEDDGRHRFND